MKEVTVNQAIKRGQQMINIPIFFIFLFLMGTAIFLYVTERLGVVGILLSFPISFIFAWLYWSIMVPRWKIWAFGEVRNVHELKAKAINQKLIWPDDSWFNKTEIWTARQRAIFELVELKFLEQDSKKPIIPAEELPTETIIRYAPFSRWLSLVLCIGFLAAAVWLAFREEMTTSGLMVICAVLTAFEGRKYLKNTPQIILTEDGISLKKAGLIRWKTVSHLFLRQEGYGKDAKQLLDIKSTQGERSIILDDLSKSPTEIEELAKSYWLAYRD